MKQLGAASSCQRVAWPSVIMWWKLSLHPGKPFSHWAAGEELNWMGDGRKWSETCCQLGGLLLCGTCWKCAHGWEESQLCSYSESAAYIYINKTASTESFNALRSKFLSFEYMLSFPTLRLPESHRGRWRVQSLRDPKRRSRHTEENQINTMSQPRNASVGIITYQVTKVHLSKVVETSSSWTWRTMNQIIKQDF